MTCFCTLKHDPDFRAMLTNSSMELRASIFGYMLGFYPTLKSAESHNASIREWRSKHAVNAERSLRHFDGLVVLNKKQIVNIAEKVFAARNTILKYNESPVGQFLYGDREVTADFLLQVLGQDSVTYMKFVEEEDSEEVSRSNVLAISDMIAEVSRCASPLQDRTSYAKDREVAISQINEKYEGRFPIDDIRTLYNALFYWFEFIQEGSEGKGSGDVDDISRRVKFDAMRDDKHQLYRTSFVKNFMLRSLVSDEEEQKINEGSAPSVCMKCAIKALEEFSWK